jgi:hypothetical protein
MNSSRPEPETQAGAYLRGAFSISDIGHGHVLVQMIMIESGRITENVRSWRTDVISAIDAALPSNKIM